MDKVRTRSPVYVRQKSISNTSGGQTSPMMSPVRRHARSGSTGVNFRRPQNYAAKAAAQRLAQVMAHQPADGDEGDEDVSLDYNPTGSIGLVSGRSMRSPSPANSSARAASQRQVHAMAHQHIEYDDDDQPLDYKPTGSLASGRAPRSRSPALGRNSIEDTSSSRSSSASRPSVAVNSVEQPPPAHTLLPARSSPSHSTVEPSPPSRFSLAGRSSFAVNSTEQPTSARASAAGRSSFAANSLEQPPSARSASVGRPSQVVKTVPMVPPSVPISLKPSSVSSSDPSTDHRRDRRSSGDFGSVNMRETGNQRSTSALQDELDMLQEEHESILEKLRLADDRCEEAEARARQLEKQAALRSATQTHDGQDVWVSTRRLEAETSKDEAASTLEQLQEAEITTLRKMAQRMILSQEEMEEVVLKRCWLARYWNLCVKHGIHLEIAASKYEYWSSLAPRPLEVVLSMGQKAKEEKSVEERDKASLDLNQLPAEAKIESMLLVEKGMRELSSLKVEDAVVLAMAKHRQVSEDSKLTVDTQNLLEACELSQDEAQDVAFKQAWLMYFWRRAKNHGLEQDIAEERLQSWLISSARSPTPHDAVDVERGLLELRKLGIESQLWEEPRKEIDPDLYNTRMAGDSDLG